MVIKSTVTPEGFVVRLIRPDGEQAWRYNNDGTVAKWADHKGPWITEPDWFAVPENVRIMFTANREASYS